MKKTLIIIAALAALVSCSKSEFDVNAPAQTETYADGTKIVCVGTGTGTVTTACVVSGLSTPQATPSSKTFAYNAFAPVQSARGRFLIFKLLVARVSVFGIND